MTMPRPVLKIYVSKEELENWKLFCKAREISSSTALRAAVRKLSGHAAPEKLIGFEAVPEQSDKARRRVHLRLSESEFEKASACAAAESTSLTQWFVNLTRARLTRDPQLGMTELAVLGESNKQLAAMGSNLNQVARRLNSMQGSLPLDDVLRVAQEIDRLKREIDAHLSQVRAVMLANRERWVIQ